MYEISDDDDSFTEPGCSRVGVKRDDTVLISSDEESSENMPNNDIVVSSDGEELPEVVIEQKKMAIQRLFLPKNGFKEPNKKKMVTKELFPERNKTNDVKVVAPVFEKPKSAHSLMLTGVNIMLPVKPYQSQVALMSKIIKGMKESSNCILESPTGSGKTLALLCSVLAWQQYERNRLPQQQAASESQAYFQQYPELQKTEVTNYIASPASKNTEVTPENLFSKINFGEKSIYQKPEENQEPSISSNKRGPYVETEWFDDDPPTEGLVSIHKKRRQGSVERENIQPQNQEKLPVTPERPIPVQNKGTPEHVKKLYALVNNLRVRTSLLVDCRLPTIYYGARTHTQLQQVIKEFKRTAYCGMVKMSILSSRDKSCIREFNRDQWKSRNDMCRACIKSITSNETNKGTGSNCKYFDNRRNLNHTNLPPAFDLEELLAEGEKRLACPYYGAREMAKSAEIVFCPYNYLIDPTIRNNLKIDLEGNIIVIDEAHNIESICRDAASLSFTQTQVQDALKEIEKVAEYRFQNEDVLNFVDALVLTLKNWNYWFQNQLALIADKPLVINKATHTWEAKHFVDTLNNHNIGHRQYNSFMNNCEIFCRRLRDDPRSLFGVSQSTGTLLESLSIVLGYLFRDEGRHMDDYTPVLERKVIGKNSGLTANLSWRKSTLDQWISSDGLTLSLYCMNPAIVMSSLHVARSIVLASGTLTPMGNIHAELGTPFPLSASPNHVIPDERVWIGVVSGDEAGPQEYTSRGTRGPFAAERFGKLIVRVCQLTPHGVLCFITSYAMLDMFKNIWHATSIWEDLHQLKHVFCEKRNSSDHEEMMKKFYECVSTKKGALLFAVYRGKVSEGMDFKDEQARAVICMSIPYPNTFDIAVKSKMQYNDKYKSRGLLAEREWLKVQAFRALNQAVGRCVRHKCDWGAVVLVDARYTRDYYTEHLAKWVLRILGKNHHTYESLQSSDNGLAAFMERMKVTDEEEKLQT